MYYSQDALDSSCVKKSEEEEETDNGQESDEGDTEDSDNDRVSVHTLEIYLQ